TGVPAQPTRAPVDAHITAPVCGSAQVPAVRAARSDIPVLSLLQKRAVDQKEPNCACPARELFSEAQSLLGPTAQSKQFREAPQDREICESPSGGMFREILPFARNLSGQKKAL